MSALAMGRPIREMGLELRPLPDVRAVESVRRLTVADVVDLAPFAGARSVAGRQGLGRHVTHANVMQIPTARFARAGDLVVAADDAFRRAPTGAGHLLAMLEDRGVAAVAARTAALREIRAELVEAAEDLGVPLIELPNSAHVSEVLGRTLEALAANQASQLGRMAAIRQELGEFVLAGGELDQLPDALAKLTGADVAVAASDGALLASSASVDCERATKLAAAWLSAGGSVAAVAERHWIVWPVTAGGACLGCLIARFDEQPDAVRIAALEYGSNNVALELLQRREAVEANARLRVGFVSDLVSDSLIEESRLRRTTALGWAPDDRYVVLLARGTATDVSALAERAHGAVPHAVAVVRRDLCLAIAPVRPAGGAVGHALADELTALGPDVRVGISGELPSAADLPRGLREAEEALRTAEAFGARPARGRTELGFLRFLSEVPLDELDAFVSDTLAPLDVAEPHHGGPLHSTLAELLATRLNLAETARRGGWHYNTVRYRLRRLEELLGPFMRDGALLQTLSLALLLRSELASAGAVERVPSFALRDDPPAAQHPPPGRLQA